MRPLFNTVLHTFRTLILGPATHMRHRIPRRRPNWGPLGKRLAVLAVAGLLCTTQALGADIFHWFKEQVLKHITISGRRTIGFHQHDVEGDRESFNLLNYQGEGGKTFTDIGYLSIGGTKILGSISFQTQVDTNRFKDPQTQKFSLNYDRKPIQIGIGDIHGSLGNTNRFATFNKLLKGASIGIDKGRFKAKALYSAARGSARTITIQGNNSAGPYYLSFGQIVDGSEQVQVDGVEMQPNLDYTINYTYGAITFVNRIIPPTSTITISFEALSNRLGSGTIQGASASYDFGKIGRLGLTAMKQKTGGSGALSTHEDLFQGGGPPSTPYPLTFEPLTSLPIIVRVDGIIQTEGVDYFFDPQNPTILFFTRFIPTTSTISVVYTPKPTQALDGDRSVWGFDYRLPIGSGTSGGFIGYSQATGKLSSAVNPMEGTARGIDGSYTYKNWILSSSIREIPDTYVSVETRGFNRNEKAVTNMLSYRGKAPWTFDLRHNNSAIGIRTVGAGGEITFQRARSTNLEANASYNRTVGEPWNLDYKRIRSHSSGVPTSADSVQLGTSRTFGRLITHVDVSNTIARGPVYEGNTPVIKTINMQGLHTRATYTAGPAWSFSLDSGINSIKSGSDSGTGMDLGATASYVPNDRLNLSTRYSVSDSGNLAVLGGFQNGFGYGYNGNGFSGGYAGTPFALGATNIRRFEIGGSARLTDRLTVSAGLLQARSFGSITSNSDTTSITGGAQLQLGNNHEMQFNVSQSTSRFVGTSTKSDALTFDAQFRGEPKGPWSYHLGINGLMTGGDSQFKQDGFSVDASLNYRLSPREIIGFDYVNGRTVGYFGQSEMYASMSYQYQIWKNLALVGSYRIRDIKNLDTSVTSGAYKARGFDIELSFTFGG